MGKVSFSLADHLPTYEKIAQQPHFISYMSFYISHLKVRSGESLTKKTISTAYEGKYGSTNADITVILFTSAFDCLWAIKVGRYATTDVYYELMGVDEVHTVGIIGAYLF